MATRPGDADISAIDSDDGTDTDVEVIEELTVTLRPAQRESSDGDVRRQQRPASSSAATGDRTADTTGAASRDDTTVIVSATEVFTVSSASRSFERPTSASALVPAAAGAPSRPPPTVEETVPPPHAGDQGSSAPTTATSRPASARLGTPLTTIAGVPGVAGAGGTSRPASRARKLPSAMATPFATPTADRGSNRVRTPSPRQQLDRLSHMPGVYPQVLAKESAKMRTMLGRGQLRDHAATTGFAATPPPASSSAAFAQATGSATPLSAYKRATARAAATPQPSTSARTHASLARPLPEVPASAYETSREETPVDPRTGARPLPSSCNVCLCLSPDVGARVDQCLRSPPPKVRIDGTMRSGPIAARGLPSFDGIDPQLEEYLPLDVLTGVERRFSRRRVFARWTARFRERRLVQQFKVSRMQHVVSRWRTQAEEHGFARRHHERAILCRAVGTWFRAFDTRRELTFATSVAQQQLMHRTLRQWTGALAHRRAQREAQCAHGALRRGCAFRIWHRKCAEQRDRRLAPARAVFAKWRACVILKAAGRSIASTVGKALLKWSAAARYTAQPAVRNTCRIETTAFVTLATRYWIRWQQAARASLMTRGSYDMCLRQCARRTLRRSWQRWCQRAGAAKAVRRRALLMKLAS